MKLQYHESMLGDFFNKIRFIKEAQHRANLMFFINSTNVSSLIHKLHLQADCRQSALILLSTDKEFHRVKKIQW